MAQCRGSHGSVGASTASNGRHTLDQAAIHAAQHTEGLQKPAKKQRHTTLHRRAHHPTPEGRGCIGCVVALKGVLLGCSGARQGGGPGECHTSPRSSPWQRCTSRGPWAAPPACGPARDGAWLPVLCCRRPWPPDRRTTAAAAAGCRTSCECPSCLGVGPSVLGARDVLPVAAAQGRSRATRARWSELGRKVSPEDVFVYVARAYWPSLCFHESYCGWILEARCASGLLCHQYGVLLPRVAGARRAGGRCVLDSQSQARAM